MSGDRLWIQRVVPKPPKSLKRKRAVEIGGVAAPTERTESPKRSRTKATSTQTTGTAQGTRQGRAAKLQARMKLDAQAKELAELNQQAKMRSTRMSARLSKSAAKVASRALGTRLSARLRGSQTNEWQPIPDGWLDGMSDNGKHGVSDNENQYLRDSKPAGEDDGSDSISELTELSDDSSNLDSPAQKSAQLQQLEPSAGGTTDNYLKGELEKASTYNFVEWETVSPRRLHPTRTPIFTFTTNRFV